MLRPHLSNSVRPQERTAGMRHHTLFLLLCLTSCVASLTAFQPYVSYRPAPIPEIGLNRNSYSPFFVETTTSMYGQLAHECFLEDLKDRYQLSALYFGSDDFRLSHMFQNCQVPTNTKNYNPYVRVLRMQPKIELSEVGSILSLRAEAAVGPKKWFHVGVKASVPFKRREISRKDIGARGVANVQDLASTAEGQIGGTDIGPVSAYRLDFIEAIPAFGALSGPADYTESVAYNLGSTTGDTTLFTSTILNATYPTSSGSIGGAIIKKPETAIPGPSEIVISDIPFGVTNTQVDELLPRNIAFAQTGKVYQVQTAADYTGILDSATKNVDQRIADQDTKATLWVIGTYNSDSEATTDSTFDLNTTMSGKIKEYNQNEYEWFYQRNYILESQIADGIGDTTVEAYIACDLFDSFQLRFRGGAVLPTARQKTTGLSPYAIHLGNRGHTEVFIASGVTIAVPKSSWFVTSDIQYTTALNALEYISATPVGAQIKNMGPETQANISWHSAQGNVWLHLQHPKTTALAFAVGYDWYAKIEDTFTFASINIESFLGKTYNAITQKFDIANPLTLDTEVAKKNTGMVSHALRLSTTYQPSPYIKFYGQLGYILAGRNCPQITEYSIGCSISY
ncbi:MAG: hypothetical protein QG632_156 [Candidatus Dependentiae bacterium]|nr:hypothetical protein [Candidatus Dependentiae bacterium]